MEPAATEATTTANSNQVAASEAGASSSAISSVNTTATSDSFNATGGVASASASGGAAVTSTANSSAPAGGSTVTSSPEAANLSTSTASTVSKQAQTVALAAASASAPLWTWVNPGQQLLSVADVRPDTAPIALPPLMGAIFAQLAATRCTQPDILFALIYAVALECGFCSVQQQQQPEQSEQSELQPLQPPPSISCWFSFNAQLVRQSARLSYPPNNGCYNHAGNFYECPLLLAGDWPEPPPACHLLARDIGGMLCVSLNTLSSGGPEQQGTSAALAVGEFVVRQQLGVAKCVKNLDKLVELLRSRVFGPVRDGLLLAMGLPSPNLLGMPEEVRRAVYRRMGLADLQRWSQVCRLAREEVLGFVRVKYPRVRGLS